MHPAGTAFAQFGQGIFRIFHVFAPSFILLSLAFHQSGLLQYAVNKRFWALRYFMWVDVVKWQPNNPKSEEKGGLI